MSERSGRGAGVPCWVDTWQADAAAAAPFYEAVLGWECAGEDAGPFMCRLRGRDVAMIGQLPPEHSHRPAAWLHYVQVDDIEQTVARVGETGGSTPLPPFDALDGGLIAIVADPAGAHFGVWQLGPRGPARRPCSSCPATSAASPRHDVDDTVARAGERGGQAVVPPFYSYFFRQAVLVDPADAAFSVSKVNVDGR